MRKDFPGEYNQPAVAFHVLIPSLMAGGLTLYHHHYLYTMGMVKSKSNLIPGINSEAKPKIIKQVSFEGQNLKIYTKMQNNFLHSFRFVSGVSYR